jgi:hypothetical protein
MLFNLYSNTDPTNCGPQFFAQKKIKKLLQDFSIYQLRYTGPEFTETENAL